MAFRDILVLVDDRAASVACTAAAIDLATRSNAHLVGLRLLADTGLLGTTGRSRQALPPFTSPATSDVVQILLEYTLIVWRADLIEYADL